MEVLSRRRRDMFPMSINGLILLVLLIFLDLSFARIHNLDLKHDKRKEIQLSTFGFLKKGFLQVNITQFSYNVKPDINQEKMTGMFGFTLDKSGSSGISSYLEDNQNKRCILHGLSPETMKDTSVSIVFFRMDLKNKRITLERRGDDLQKLDITASGKPHGESRGSLTMGITGKGVSDNNLMQKHPPEPFKDPQPKPNQNGQGRKKRAVERPPPPKVVNVTVTDATVVKTANGKEAIEPLPLTLMANNTFTTYFEINVESDKEEGLYNLYFHNCLNFEKEMDSEVHLQLKITESNDGNFLSAGEIPIPVLFFSMSVVYFAVGIFWMVVLRKAKEDVYKIHYLMFAVIMVKSLACLFHAVNMHFIAIEGMHEEAWAVLYYIVYLSRGALLFVTIILIGAGWAFVKHVLSDKEKKLFLIVIPLQILDNIAYIIVEESEEGQSQYMVWQEIFIFVDLLCCGAILFPVVWSIRHLKQATRTDGKAEISLLKLSLFRQFYIMVVCYIYFTRIIVYLIRITVPFQYEWLDELFRELATCIFFTITGYKFQPAPDNPYLQVPQEEDDEELEMEEVITKSGAFDSVTRVNKGNSSDQGAQLKQRESSHEYD